MLTSKKELAQKEKKSLFVKDIVTKNPVFSKQHIQQFYIMFNLYCDSKRQCDIGDILNTAKTLGFQKKYKIIFKAIQQITLQLNGTWIDFQTFLSLLTDKIGNPFSQKGRTAMFNLIDPQNKNQLDFDDLSRVSQLMKFNLGPEQIQQVINNVAGFGKTKISRDQFYKYIAKKVDKKNLL